MIDVPRNLPLPIARALIGIEYPATRDELIDYVLGHGGQPQVLATLRALPSRRFAEQADLATELHSTQ